MIAGSFLEQELTRGTTERPVLLALPAPRLDPLDLLATDPAAEMVFWRDRHDRVLAGVGVAAEVTARGPDRFAVVRRAVDDLLGRIVVRTPAEAGAPPVPRLLGGFAFAPGGAAAGAWSAFGDARFTLPRLALHDAGAGRWLLAAVDAAWVDGQGGAGAVAERLERLAASGAAAPRGDAGPTGATGPGTTPAAAPGAAAAFDRSVGAAAAASGSAAPGSVASGSAAPRSAASGSADAAAWEARVRAALASIDAGAADKLVLARRASRPFPATDPALDPVPLLRRLDGAVGAAGSYRFAFRRGGALFLGATPERLVAVTGRELRTEALAGTADVAADGGEPLERRGKDLHEHEVVVRTIADALAPLCEELEHDDAPRVREAGPVRHLATAFRGRLARAEHVLRVAEALHPTPAVGGWPTDAALRWLAEHEPEPRGWYAAPVGWIDAEGNGELAVALRCGLAHDGRIDLYAGAGIVRGSDPAAEYRETELKMRALPQALGLEP